MSKEPKPKPNTEGRPVALEDFVNRTTNVAEKLARHEADGTYIEAYLLISATLSGMASWRWPGTGGDRRRFVELWARFADTGLTPNKISLPLLVPDLKRAGKTQEALALSHLRARGFRESDLVVTGDEVDVDEFEAQKVCPSLTLKELRKFSYPVLFYERIRSSIVHEYELGEGTTPWADALEARGVSYGNFLLGRAFSFDSERRIHFPISWLVQLSKSIASQISTLGPKQAAPSKWWVDG